MMLPRHPFGHKQLAMVQSNRARVEKGVLFIDRKFHLGMQRFVDALDVPIVAIVAESVPGEPIMDQVEIPLGQLGYRVLTVKVNRFMLPERGAAARLAEEISRSRLVYGSALGSGRLARALGVPYIPILETDLGTQVRLAASQVSGVRKAVHGVRSVLSYTMTAIPDMCAAHSLHCNGYPIYDESGRFNGRRLLYLDSRMSAAQVIPADRLAQRLAGRGSRPLRLLFSGRYEPMKGAADAIRVALGSARRGVPIEMHCYGRGSLREEMRRIAAEAPSGTTIEVHDAISYPELVERSYGFDLFVACHIQADPSCTYLESLGAGLPVVGYGNGMWRRLSGESAAGWWSPLGKHDAVVDHVVRLAGDNSSLIAMSEAARRFAAGHTFEHEFRRRTDALTAALAEAPGLSN